MTKNDESMQKDERVARVERLALWVWEQPDLARVFLESHQPQLGGERPIDLARRDTEGAERVERLLWQLEWSLPC